MKFRIVFWDVLPSKIIVDNYFTRKYVPEDNSELHTCRRENLKSHKYVDDCLLGLCNGPDDKGSESPLKLGSISIRLQDERAQTTVCGKRDSCH
jgi:hypothetical protein